MKRQCRRKGGETKIEKAVNRKRERGIERDKEG